MAEGSAGLRNIGAVTLDSYLAAASFTKKEEIEKAAKILDLKLNSVNKEIKRLETTDETIVVFPGDTDPLENRQSCLETTYDQEIPLSKKNPEEYRILKEKRDNLNNLKQGTVFVNKLFTLLNLSGNRAQDIKKIKAYRESCENYYEKEKNRNSAESDPRPIKEVDDGPDYTAGQPSRRKRMVDIRIQARADFEAEKAKFSKKYGMPSPVINGDSLKDNIAAIGNEKQWFVKNNGNNQNRDEINICGKLSAVLQYVLKLYNEKAVSA